MSSKNNLTPRPRKNTAKAKPVSKPRTPEEEARAFERARGRENRIRINLRIPVQLKEQLYAEANATGRYVTDIIVDQLSRRYTKK